MNQEERIGRRLFVIDPLTPPGQLKTKRFEFADEIRFVRSESGES
jgi:hypothetical protein